MAPAIKLSKQQRSIARRKAHDRVFLEGPAGTGKTTTGVERLAHLVDGDIPGRLIAVIVPQRTLALPYYAYLDQPALRAGEPVMVTTVGGVARQMVDLFWPLVAEEAGFGLPDQPPTFLTLETAQYFMAHVAGPVIDREGYFDSIAIDRNRLYSQLIDNLNKAAVVGFPYTEIAARLKSAWVGDESQRRVYDEAQTCAALFRAFCLEHNLLDFSLQMELLTGRLWPLPVVQEHLKARFRHLIVDNIEEDTPAAHYMLGEWLTACDSALVIYDTEAGYRRFLGADPDYAYRLKEVCQQHETFTDSYVMGPHIPALGERLAASLRVGEDGAAPVAVEGDIRAVLRYENHRYHPEMVDWTAAEITRLVQEEGVNPAQIVVLSPYLSDALRFSLMNRLETNGVPVRSHRPSRALREEPAAVCLLTLGRLAHPQWGMRPADFDVVYALMQTIGGMDLVRARLLQSQALTNPAQMKPFEAIGAEFQTRITYEAGERYERLRAWLETYRAGEPEPFDHFLSRLFGEVLSQPGFGFHDDFDAAEVASDLVDSARKFRQIVTDSGALPDSVVAQEYVSMVGQGVIADQYLRRWALQAEDAVLLAPAYTFLMSNRPAAYQFWLSVGGSGWAERLYQPLTNPYVLSLNWTQGAVWTDAEEFAVSRESLYRLTLGLIRRCGRALYLGLSELGEQGFEQRGELLEAIQRMLRRGNAG